MPSNPMMGLIKRLMPKATFMENFVGAEREEVAHIFKQLRLPIPRDGFLPATEGGLIFHTDAGVVIRAERKHSFKTAIYEFIAKRFDLDFGIIKPHLRTMSAERIDHEHILQPIASFETANHVIEIVPGRKLGVTNEDVDALTKNYASPAFPFGTECGLTIISPSKCLRNWFARAVIRTSR